MEKRWDYLYCCRQSLWNATVHLPGLGGDLRKSQITVNGRFYGKVYKSTRKRIQKKLIKFATRISVFMYLTNIVAISGRL